MKEVEVRKKATATIAPPPPCLEQTDLEDGLETQVETDIDDTTSIPTEESIETLTGPKRKRTRRRNGRKETAHPAPTTGGKKKVRRNLSMTSSGFARTTTDRGKLVDNEFARTTNFAVDSRRPPRSSRREHFSDRVPDA